MGGWGSWGSPQLPGGPEAARGIETPEHLEHPLQRADGASPEHPVAAAGRGARRARREPGGHGGHSALINLCPPAPGEAAGAAARSPLPSLYKHLLTPLLSAIDCRLVDTLGSCKFITRTAGKPTRHASLAPAPPGSALAPPGSAPAPGEGSVLPRERGTGMCLQHQAPTHHPKGTQRSRHSLRLPRTP